ncbi:hypothetical protein [Pseudomonas aeruginosa]|uniref:hypothetical protein n=1 Tax=Pseudomonas aeruginosa TaxID=287 RepID=UPI003DAA3EDE
MTKQFYPRLTENKNQEPSRQAWVFMVAMPAFVLGCIFTFAILWFRPPGNPPDPGKNAPGRPKTMHENTFARWPHQLRSRHEVDEKPLHANQRRPKIPAHTIASAAMKKKGSKFALAISSSPLNA